LRIFSNTAVAAIVFLGPYIPSDNTSLSTNTFLSNQLNLLWKLPPMLLVEWGSYLQIGLIDTIGNIDYYTVYGLL
jgi:hypothetical protein